MSGPPADRADAPAALDGLLAVLRELADTLQALDPTLAAAEAAARCADVAALAEATGRMEALAQTLAALERRRRGLVAALAGGEAITLSGLVTRWPARAPALRAAREELAALLAAGAERSRRLGAAAEHGLAVLERLVADLWHGLHPAPVYGATGRPGPNLAGPGRVDRRA